MDQKMAYNSMDKLVIAGTRDFSRDHIDDLKLQMNDTLHKTERGQDADMYYRSHHEIDTLIGRSLGGAVALSLENSTNKKVITHTGWFNLKLSVPQLYQVIPQAPTLT